MWSGILKTGFHASLSPCSVYSPAETKLDFKGFLPHCVSSAFAVESGGLSRGDFCFIQGFTDMSGLVVSNGSEVMGS